MAPQSLFASLTRRTVKAFREEGVLAIPRRGFGLLYRLWRQYRFKPYVIQKKIGDLTFKFEIADIWDEDWFLSSNERGHGEMNWILSNIRPGMTVIDCGAHHGFFTMLFSHCVGPNGRVHAIEALPNNARVLRKNLELNKITNVTVYNTAVGSTFGEIEFVASHHGVKESNGRPVLNESMRGEIKVPLTTMDALLPNVTPDFMKVDVEGFELEVLRGARTLLSAHPGIDLEIHSVSFAEPVETIKSIFELIDVAKYNAPQIEPIVNQPLEAYDQSLHSPSRLAKLENVHLLISPGTWKG